MGATLPIPPFIPLQTFITATARPVRKCIAMTAIRIRRCAWHTRVQATRRRVDGMAQVGQQYQAMGATWRFILTAQIWMMVQLPAKIVALLIPFIWADPFI